MLSSEVVEGFGCRLIAAMRFAPWPASESLGTKRTNQAGLAMYGTLQVVIAVDAHCVGVHGPSVYYSGERGYRAREELRLRQTRPDREKGARS
jgi:hypothetical protein